MYHRNNANIDKPFQTVQLFSLKRKNTTTLIKLENNKLQIVSNEQIGGILTILGFYYLTTTATIDEQIFKAMNFEQCPKQFQSYCDQKTMKVLLKLIIENSQSQESLIQLLNQYPVISFVVQAYCRASCINFIRYKKELDDNQREILQNFSCDLRGCMMDFCADCLEMYVTLTCGQVVETHGQQRYNKKVQIKFTESGIQAELNRKPNLPYARTIQNSAIRSLKYINIQQTQSSQSQQISTIQSNSLLKDTPQLQVTKCDKCKMLKSRCYCSKKFISYGTPNSATKLQRTSIGAGIAANIATLNAQVIINQLKGKCSCNKLFCTCKR